jgi:hypothetical protein
MSSIPTHIASGLAATSHAQARGVEADRVRHEDAVRHREDSADKSAEAAAGIDETKDQQASGDRDADGRRVIEWPGGKKQRGAASTEESSTISNEHHGPRSKDPTGQAGSQLDLDG